jgi:hypothetical protein
VQPLFQRVDRAGCFRRPPANFEQATQIEGQGGDHGPDLLWAYGVFLDRRLAMRALDACQNVGDVADFAMKRKAPLRLMSGEA